MCISQNNHNLNLLKEEYESLKEKVAQSEQLGKLTTRINAERKLLQSAIERETQKEDLLKSINQKKKKLLHLNQIIWIYILLLVKS